MILVQRSPNCSASSHSGDLGIVDRNRVESLNRPRLEIVDDTRIEHARNFPRKVTAVTYGGKKLGRDMGFQELSDG